MTLAGALAFGLTLILALILTLALTVTLPVPAVAGGAVEAGRTPEQDRLGLFSRFFRGRFLFARFGVGRRCRHRFHGRSLGRFRSARFDILLRRSVDCHGGSFGRGGFGFPDSL